MAGALGKTYDDGELIVRQGDEGNCMYVIQEGKVEISVTVNGENVVVATRGEGEFIGEMAIFDREVRSANARAKGQARLLTVDKKNLLARINSDPSLAFRLIQTLTGRVRELTDETARLKSGS